MLINPLEKKNNSTIELAEIDNQSTNRIVNSLIDYLLETNIDLLEKSGINTTNNKTIEEIIKEKIYKQFSNITFDINTVIKQIFDRLFGYYILQKYIDNPDISDIRLINWETIFIMKKGAWQKTEEKFLNEEDYINFIRYCILKNKGKISEEKPIAVVSDKKYHLRIEAGISPANPISPSLVIRIHRPYKYEDMEYLMTNEVRIMNMEIYCFLLKAITAGCNIIISGKGASGKTTLLRALINKIPENISITSNEETAELFSKHKNIIQREIVNNRDDEKNITLEKLMAEALLMTNDAIVVGEMKGKEAMAFLDAVATGHRGYATIHSDSSEATLDRLVTLMKRDEKALYYTEGYLKQILAQSIDIIIYMKNFKITEIAEIVKQENTIKMNMLYKFEIEQIINKKMIGFFKKVNDPTNKVKEKLEKTKQEVEEIYGGQTLEKNIKNS